MAKLRERKTKKDWLEFSRHRMQQEKVGKLQRDLNIWRTPNFQCRLIRLFFKRKLLSDEAEDVKLQCFALVERSVEGIKVFAFI